MSDQPLFKQIDEQEQTGASQDNQRDASDWPGAVGVASINAVPVADNATSDTSRDVPADETDVFGRPDRDEQAS